MKRRIDETGNGYFKDEDSDTDGKLDLLQHQIIVLQNKLNEAIQSLNVHEHRVKVGESYNCSSATTLYVKPLSEIE